MPPDDSNPVTAILAKLALLFGTSTGERKPYVSFPVLAPPITTRDLDFLEGRSDLEEVERYSEALEFATLVNEIPEVGIRWRGSDRLLWAEYGRVFDEAEWATAERSEEEQRRLREARETAAELRDSYEEHRQVYWDTARALEERKLTARHAEDPEVVSEAEAEIERLEREVEAARRAWLDEGHRAEYEAAVEEIHRLTRSGPWAMRTGWEDQFDRGVRTDIGSNQRFYWTEYWPQDFVDGDASWQTVTLDSSEVESLTRTAAEELPELPDSDLVENDLQADLTVEGLSFDVATLTVRRPWFDSNLLDSGAWRWQWDREPISDGGDPPEGRIPAYVTELVFVKNLTIDLETDESTRETVQALREGLIRNFGPIVLEQPASTTAPAQVTRLESASFDPTETAALHAFDRELTAAPVAGSGSSSTVLSRSAEPIANEPRLRAVASIIAGNNVASAAARGSDDEDDSGRPDTLRMVSALDSVAVRPHDEGSDESGGGRDDSGRARPRRVVRRDHRRSDSDSDEDRDRTVVRRDHRRRSGGPRIEIDEDFVRDVIIRDHRRGGGRDEVSYEGRITEDHPVEPDDSPIGGARLTFQSSDADVEKTVKTDEDGRYHVDLPPGSFVVTVRAYGYETHTDEVEVESGAQAVEDFALAPTDVTVERWESMQLIGSVCRTVPKSPDPAEELWEDD